MKSEKAKDGIERFRITMALEYKDELNELCRLFKEIAEVAEQEAEERIYRKAHNIIKEMMDGIFRGDMPQKIADEFIRKLNEK